MIESRAQGRARVRLVEEKREQFRRLYAEALGTLSRSQRREWAITLLTHEHPERYRELYVEEKEKLLGSVGEKPSVDSALVGKSSGSGPFHAVLTDGLGTLCGRVRFRAYPASADRQVDCSYCIDSLRRESDRAADPEFRALAATAQLRVREFADLLARGSVAQDALLGSLSALHTPPAGTPERALLVKLLGEVVATGMTLGEIGKPMNLSRERIRQIVAEGAELADGEVAE